MKPIYSVLLIIFLLLSCNVKQNLTNRSENMTAEQILGNPNYQAISYGGYRQKSRDIQPTIAELKEDLKIMYAMGFRILRTYNVHLAEASNLMRAIREMKTENPNFEMYVMLGAWIDCKNAWTHLPVDHNHESENNEIEIHRAVEMTNQYPEIVKVIAVGNEAMVKWATSEGDAEAHACVPVLLASRQGTCLDTHHRVAPTLLSAVRRPRPYRTCQRQAGATGD